MGRFVGVADNVGHALTYKILTDDFRIIFRSRIRTAEDTTVKNKILEPITDEILKSKFNRDDTLPTIDPDTLIGRTFLKEPNDDGIRLRAKIIERIENEDTERSNDPRFIRFRCSVNDDQFEDIITYIDVINHIGKDDGNNDEWKFKSIIGYQGALSRSDKEYMGSRYNVLVDWENGEPLYEPLDIIAKDDPVTCAVYGKSKGLLGETGWKRFKRIIDQERKFNRMINQAKLQSPQLYKENIQFGAEVPRHHNHAMRIDLKKSNKLWYQAEQVELKQIFEYNILIKEKGMLCRMIFQKLGFILYMRSSTMVDVKHA